MPAPYTFSIARIGAIPLLLALSAGCWEEIRYTPPDATSPTDGNPSASAPQATDAVVPATRDVPAPAAPQATETTAAATPSPIPASSELFGATPPAGEAPREIPGPEDAAPQKPVDEKAVSAPTSASADDRLRVWTAAGKWSLAWAIYAKGLEASRYEPSLAEANAAAAALGVELPPLPSSVDGAQREAAVTEALGGNVATQLTAHLGERLTPAEAAVAELAIRSHRLLLTYSPRDENAASQAETLREAAQASALPAELWEPLLKLLEERAPLLDVRQAVFDMHRRVAQRLSEK